MKTITTKIVSTTAPHILSQQYQYCERQFVLHNSYTVFSSPPLNDICSTCCSALSDMKCFRRVNVTGKQKYRHCIKYSAHYPTVSAISIMLFSVQVLEFNMVLLITSSWTYLLQHVII